MNKSVKVISAVMAGTICLTMSGCSLLNLGGSKVSTSKLISFAQDKGSEEYDDYDDFYDTFATDNGSKKKVKKGGYILLTDKDLKKYLKDDDVSASFDFELGYEKTMTQAVSYVIGDVSSDDKWAMEVIAIDFESADAAEDYFGDLSDRMEDNIDSFSSDLDVDTDDGEDNGISYRILHLDVESRNAVMNEGLYLDGKSVIILVAMDMGTDEGGELLQEFCSQLGIPDPSDM